MSCVGTPWRTSQYCESPVLCSDVVPNSCREVSTFQGCFTNLTTATILDTVTLIAPITTAKEKFAVQDAVAARLKDKMEELLPRLRS